MSLATSIVRATRVAARAPLARAQAPITRRAFTSGLIRKDANEYGVNHIPGSTTSPGSEKVVPDSPDTIKEVSFKDGKASVETFASTKQSAVVNPEGADIEHKAQALDADLIAKMPLTIQKFTLGGKIAVVTGGGRGLGYNMCQALAESGIKGIAIFDVQEELGMKSAGELSAQTGVDVKFYKVDVRDEQGIQSSVQRVVDHFGKIDVLISSAGIADSNLPAIRYPSDMFRRLIDINVTGTFLVAQAVAQKMIETKTPGSMVFVASMSGSIVNYPQEQSCYNASKAAVVQLTRSLAAEWARYNIRVNAISPGYMDTALNRVPALDAQKRIWVDNTPQKRLGNVDELNNLAVFLSSEGSSYMTGSNVLIDGGYTLW